LDSFHTLYISEDNKTILLRAAIDKFNTPFFNQFTYIGEEGSLPDMIDCTPTNKGFQLRMAPNNADVLLVQMQHRLNTDDLAASLYDKESGGALEGYLRLFEPLCVTRKKEPIPMPVDLKLWTFLGGKKDYKGADKTAKQQNQQENGLSGKNRMQKSRMKSSSKSNPTKGKKRNKKRNKKRHFTRTGPITEVLIDITSWIESFATLVTESLGGLRGGMVGTMGGRGGVSHLMEARGFPLNMYFKYMTQSPIMAPVKRDRHQRRGGNNYTLYYSVAFCKLPDEVMISRQKDRRVGFFETSVVRGGVNNVNQEYNVINKWNINRRKHILYCIDPAVPSLYHDTIKKGVLSWNEAFEHAGCGSNVVQCLSENDDNFPTDYARGDARYSAIYMTDPAIPVYGFGPSLTDFRSGEIIVSHVLLGFSAFTEGTSR
jgi:hypothetical protein